LQDVAIQRHIQFHEWSITEPIYAIEHVTTEKNSSLCGHRAGYAQRVCESTKDPISSRSVHNNNNNNKKKNVASIPIFC